MLRQLGAGSAAAYFASCASRRLPPNDRCSGGRIRIGLEPFSTGQSGAGVSPNG